LTLPAEIIGLIDKDKGYELSDKLIKSQILIGKSKAEIWQLPGDETANQDTLNILSLPLHVANVNF
jgi:hypothetical protein